MMMMMMIMMIMMSAYNNERVHSVDTRHFYDQINNHDEGRYVHENT